MIGAMSRFAFLYWTGVCLGVGYYWGKTDAATEWKQLAFSTYDGLVDYTAARVEAQRQKTRDAARLEAAMKLAM